MITVKQAVASAIAFVSDLLDAQSITLEEVDFTSDKRYWLITLGFIRPDVDGDMRTLVAALNGQGIREYKIFEVDRETGETISMKIRELARAA